MELPVFPSIRFPRAAPTNAANTPLSPMIPIKDDSRWQHGAATCSDSAPSAGEGAVILVAAR